MKPATQPDKRVLRLLALGVQDIINEFESLGFSKPHQPDDLPPQGALPGFEGISQQKSEDVDDAELEEFEETESEYPRFDREDIEVGIDSLISRLIRHRLVDEEKAGRRPTLWRVFRILYGESHPILEYVDRFEQHVKGYFDTIGYEEMDAALEDLLTIQELISQGLNAQHA